MKWNRISILLIFAISLCSSIIFAQTLSVIDSLKRVEQTTASDSIKIDVQILLHSEYSRKDTSLAIAYIKKAILLSKKINDSKRICKSYINLGYYYWEKGRLADARQALSNAEKLLLTISDKNLEADFQMKSAVINYSEGSYAVAIAGFFRAATIYESLGDDAGKAKCFLNIGSCYWQLNNLDHALDYFLKASEIQKSISDELSLSKTLGNIGLIYRGKNEYSKALEYYLKSLEINQKNDMKNSEAINLQNIGSLYLTQEKYIRAMYYFDEARKVSQEVDDQIGILYAEHSMGNVYMALKNYNKAILLFKNSLTLAKKLKVNEEIKAISRDFSVAYEKMGDYGAALKFRKRFEFWKDSLINENHLNKVKELELKFETAKKNKEITLLTKENEVQLANAKEQKTFQNALVGGLMLLAIIAGLIFHTLRSRLRNQKLVAEKNEEIRMSQIKEQLGTLEMKALRAQMNPHFLFNCMNSINRMIMEEENDKASKYLSKFSKLVRLMLENSENPKVTLKDELLMLKSYIELESIRFKNKMEYNIEVADAIDQESTFIPSMVLQPFVENAIWHGLLHKDSKGLLTINIKEEGDNLHCTIIDNGVGREKSLKLRKRSGHKKISMGIKITTDRLKLLTKQKINEAIKILDLKDDNNNALGTQVDILIPVS